MVLGWVTLDGVVLDSLTLRELVLGRVDLGESPGFVRHELTFSCV